MSYLSSEAYSLVSYAKVGYLSYAGVEPPLVFTLGKECWMLARIYNSVFEIITLYYILSAYALPFTK